jgi:hypothetical protein
MSTTIQLPRNTLKEILDSIDELVQFSEESSIDLNIITENERVQIYIRIPSIVMVHELTPGGDIEISADSEERICLNPATLSEVINKADQGMLEIEFLEHDYVIKYEDEGSYSEPLTLRLRQFVESEFQELPEFQGMKQVGSLDRQSLFRSLDIMSSISPVVRIGVENDILSVEVKDKVAGQGNVKPKLTNSEIESAEAWYSIDPIIRFLRRVTSGDEVKLYMNEAEQLLLQIESSSKISRLYITSRIEEP